MAELDARRLALARALLQGERQGWLEVAAVRAALADLLGSAEAVPPLGAVTAEVATLLGGSAAGESLLASLRATRFAAALRAHFARREGQSLAPETTAVLSDLPLGVPVGWSEEPVEGRIDAAVGILLDHLWLQPRRAVLPLLTQRVEEARAAATRAVSAGPRLEAFDGVSAALRSLRSNIAGPDIELGAILDRLHSAAEAEASGLRAAVRQALLSPAEPLPERLAGPRLLEEAAVLFRETQDPSIRQSLLDFVLCWPTPRLIPTLLAMATDAASRERASLVLTLRLGGKFGADWEAWGYWLNSIARPRQRQWASARSVDPATLVLLWAAASGRADAEAEHALGGLLRARTETILPAEIFGRWRQVVSPEEKVLLLARSAAALTLPQPERARFVTAASDGTAASPEGPRQPALAGSGIPLPAPDSLPMASGLTPSAFGAADPFTPAAGGLGLSTAADGGSPPAEAVIPSTSLESRQRRPTSERAGSLELRPTQPLAAATDGAAPVDTRREQPPIAVTGGATPADAGRWQPPVEVTGGSMPAGIRPTQAGVAARAERPRPTPRPAPPAEPEPSLWHDHLRGFVSENWYLLAGILMVVAGSSLLAYFTWDRHWLLRYTIVPGLLAAFTAGLGYLASWLEQRTDELAATAAILRGAAVGLLPVNFMTVALLAADPQVTHKLMVVPAMATAYLFLAGLGLGRVSREVDLRISPSLPRALLFLNALVLLRPLVEWMVRGSLGPAAAVPALTLGFYLGFFVLAGAVLGFVRETLDRELATERRVPLFFFGTLVVTGLQVFAWVHGSLGQRPDVTLYGPLLVLAGGLVLTAERRFAEVLGEEDERGPSFLGYAAILLGLLFSAAGPETRVVTFLLGGVVWLAATRTRRAPIHAHLGLALTALGVAALGLLDVFPRPLIAVLGIVVALGLELVARVAGGRNDRRLRNAAVDLEGATLLLTPFVAVLAQWHFHSEPWVTALELGIVAALFAMRAAVDQRPRAAFAALLVLALTLPYLGCADVLGRSLEGNTLPFGLAILSFLLLGFVALRPTPLLRSVRSAALLTYGVLATGAVVLRVLFERGRPVAPDWYLAFPGWGGPILMALALVATAWVSRSLVPMGLATLIVVVLLPEMKAGLQTTFPALSWGTGLGSASTGFGLLLLSFALRRWRRLRNLGEGDSFLGIEAMPFCRYDHTLFTLPLVLAAGFLLVKVDTWTLLRHLEFFPLKTALAFAAAGLGWATLAVYGRRSAAALVAVHLAWANLLIAILAGWPRLFGQTRFQWRLAAFGVALLGLELLARVLARGEAEFLRSLFAEPFRRVLRAGAVVGGVVLFAVTLAGHPQDRISALGALVAALLVRFALEENRHAYGALVSGLALVFTLAYATPGDGALVSRLSFELSLTPAILFALVVLVVALLFEAVPETAARLRSLLAPALGWATALAGILAVVVLVDALGGLVSSPIQVGLLLLVLALTARAHGEGAFAIAAAGVAYLLVAHAELASLTSSTARMEALVDPLRLGLFALALALLVPPGRFLDREAPVLLRGSLGFRFLGGPVAPWFEAVAVLASTLVVARHSLDAGLRGDRLELLAVFLAVATHLVVRFTSGLGFLAGTATLFLVLGNVHGVRIFAGPWLLDHGLSEMHLVALGLAVTLAQGYLVKLVAPREAVQSFVNQAGLLIAGLVLFLLAAHYVADPDLVSMSSWRLVLSGAMALGAGFYFRRAARHPEPGETPFVRVAEGLYHAGDAVAVWCAVLLIPVFRSPHLVLLALAAPALFFAVRAEIGNGTEVGDRYRRSASAVGFFLLALYVFRPVFRMVLFPDLVLSTEHYHTNAAFAMGLGLLLFRLRGLGGTPWLAFYGGLSLVTGSFFALTSWPGLSPFEHLASATWCALGLAHFWTVASTQASPLRTLIQDISNIGEEEWTRLRTGWGRLVLIATQLLLVLSLLDASTSSYAVAPLLLVGASLFLHQGIPLGSRTYMALAACEALAALHADFVTPSALDRHHVIWVVLLLFGVSVLVLHSKRQALVKKGSGRLLGALAGLTFAHVLYQHPDSRVGLAAVALLAALAVVAPVADATARGGRALSATLLLLAPGWLVYFASAPLTEMGPSAILDPWAVLTGLAALLLTGLLCRHHQATSRRPPRPREATLFHVVQALTVERGGTLFSTTLVASSLGALVLLASHQTAFAAREFALFVAVLLGLAVAWYHEGALRRSPFPYFLAEASLVGCFWLVRRQLMLTVGGWTPEYDVWAMLGASLLLSGAKRAVDRGEEAMRLPAVFSIAALPVLAVFWAVSHDLSTDMILVISGLYGLMFAYLGREERDSGYNFAAVVSFVSFVALVFWAKLGLRVVHAYSIPVGLGVLLLLQLFGRHVSATTRSGVRFVTLGTMIGSAAYYALLDERYTLVFNLTLLVLCLGVMALGSLLRVRLYLVLGFCGVAVDLLSLFVKTLAHMERGPRMTSVGVFVLLLGVLLVGGTVYRQANRDEIDDWFLRLRSRFHGWE